MTRQDVIDLYGKNVYQIRLAVALGLLGDCSTTEALTRADRFVLALLMEDLGELVKKFSSAES